MGAAVQIGIIAACAILCHGGDEQAVPFVLYPLRKSQNETEALHGHMGAGGVPQRGSSAREEGRVDLGTCRLGTICAASRHEVTPTVHQHGQVNLGNLLGLRLQIPLGSQSDYDMTFVLLLGNDVIMSRGILAFRQAGVGVEAEIGG